MSKISKKRSQIGEAYLSDMNTDLKNPVVVLRRRLLPNNVRLTSDPKNFTQKKIHKEDFAIIHNENLAKVKLSTGSSLPSSSTNQHTIINQRSSKSVKIVKVSLKDKHKTTSIVPHDILSRPLQGPTSVAKKNLRSRQEKKASHDRVQCLPIVEVHGRVSCRKSYNMSSSSIHDICVKSRLTQDHSQSGAEKTENKNKDKENVCNRTYELVEPKTQNLREKYRKHSFVKAGSNEIQGKKCSGVRLANLMAKNTSTRELSIDHESYRKLAQFKKSRSVNGDMPVRSGKILRTRNVPLREGSNFINDGKSSFLSSTSSQIDQRSKSSTSINKSTLPVTSGFPVKKSDPKLFTTKKVPNFMEIHKKLFAKSESLVAAKKRLEERHATLTRKQILSTNVVSVGTNPSRMEPNKGNRNQLGYKLRKKEATKYILNEHQLGIREEKERQQREKSKEILKGVRTNRRFEIQMKFRNISSCSSLQL